MADTTCRKQALEGVIRGTNFTITLSGGADSVERKGLVQSFSLQFQRRLSRIYDLTSPSFYYIEGPSVGQVAFNKIVGPKGAPKLNCDCTPRTIILDTGPTICYPTNADRENNSYTLEDAMPFGMAGQGSSDNYLIYMSQTYLFGNLK